MAFPQLNWDSLKIHYDACMVLAFEEYDRYFVGSGHHVETDLG